MEHIGHPTRIRKSLAALKDTDQRKGYFYCLKLLGVLPVPPDSDLQQWVYRTMVSKNEWPDQKKYYKPKCLHDVLISSHATSCEHMNIYFSFYHRHLTILCQIFLNFAHQILLGGLEKLKEVYPPKSFIFLYQGKRTQYWKVVFEKYKSFKGIPDEIANHYWAPTNYQNDADLSILQELSYKKVSSDPIDVLFLSINKSYPWELHVPRRWYNKEQDYNQNDIRFKKQNACYNQNQKKFISGQLDPRKPPENRKIYQKTIYDKKNRLHIKFLFDHYKNNQKAINYRIYRDFVDSGKKNFQLNIIPPNQSLANYGAKSKNLQYITNDQQKEYKLTCELVQNFNMSFPHYQYAFSLFAYGIGTFIEDSKQKGVENAHNVIHNNFCTILNDDNYSVTSLLFYPYHGWIDAMIQFKLRWGNRAENKKESYDYFLTKLDNNFHKVNPSTTAKLKSIFEKISKKMKPMTEWHISKDSEIKQMSGGIYPVLQWIHPGFENASLDELQLSPAFCSRDYILTQDSIRDSHRLNQIYHNKHYVELHKKRYGFFKRLNQFNYNYNYQIGSDPKDINVLLDEYATNIPEYLKRIQKDIKTKIGPLTIALNAAVEQKKRLWLDQIAAANKTIASKLSEQYTFLFEEIHQKRVQKLFKGNVLLFAKYPSNTENGHNPIYVKLNNLFQQLYPKLSISERNDLQRYVHHGLNVGNILIFGKAEYAGSCFKCVEDKHLFLNLDQDIRLRIPQIWKNINLLCLNQVYYDSNQQITVKSVLDKIQLVPNQKFPEYKLIEGAQEIFVDVQTNINTDEPKFIRIDTQSYSIYTERIKMVLTKKYTTFKTDFDFYKLYDVDQEDNKRAYFDRFVYKTLKVWVSVGKQRMYFRLNIPNYQRLLRLTLQIKRVEGKMIVRVLDSDYSAKRKYYKSFKC